MWVWRGGVARGWTPPSGPTSTSTRRAATTRDKGEEALRLVVGCGASGLGACAGDLADVSSRVRVFLYA